MADISTPNSKSEQTTRQRVAEPTPGPKTSTIAFLRQFARCYSAVPAMQPQLAGIVLN